MRGGDANRPGSSPDSKTTRTEQTAKALRVTAGALDGTYVVLLQTHHSHLAVAAKVAAVVCRAVGDAVGGKTHTR